MKRNLLFSMIFLVKMIVQGQTIDRIDGTKITADSLEYKIEWLMQKANVHGLAISVFNNNKPVFSKTFGWANLPKNQPLTSHSIMYAASLSKMVFAYLVMQLVQQGKIDLDKPLVQYLDSNLVDYVRGKWNGYQYLAGDDRYNKITARMCLDHTTGFANWRWFEPDQKLKIHFEPGSRYNYSGEGLLLLQFVIERITHKDYETLAQEWVFRPLNMQNTSQLWQARFDSTPCYGHNAKGKTYKLKKRSEANAAGSMSTTLEDFTAFYTALINSKNLDPNSFTEMISPPIMIRSIAQFGPLSKVDSNTNDEIKLSYGLGVGLFQTKYGKAFFKEGHDDGWGHYTICYPDKKIAIIIMTNSDNGESIFKDLLANAIGDIYTPWQWENYIPYNQKK